MTWVSNTHLVIAGDLKIGGNSTTMVTFNSQNHQFTEFTGSGSVPGPVTALCPANRDASQFWVAGSANDGSAFLERFDGKQWLSASEGLGAGTTIRGLQVLSLAKNHDSTNLISDNQVLLVLGQINVTSFGNASAVLFNGTAFTPFLLSTSQNAPGSLSQAFVENPQNFFSSGGVYPLRPPVKMKNKDKDKTENVLISLQARNSPSASSCSSASRSLSR